MPKFDIQTFSRVTNTGGSIAAATGSAFGVPSCIMNLVPELLNLLPSGILLGVKENAQAGRDAADSVTKSVSAKLRQYTGIIEFDTENGVFRFVSNSSTLGSDGEGLLGSVVGFVGKLQAAASFGSQLYENVLSVDRQIQHLTECFSSYRDFLKYTGGNAGDERANLPPEDFEALVEATYAADIQQAQDANDFITDADALIANIITILAARDTDPSLEPTDVPPVIEDIESVFRLEAGPPKSIKGKFILSVDGMYYDSQENGTIPALVELTSRESVRRKESDWKLEYDPNLGGRGAPTTIDDLNSYFNTILDPGIIDDSDYLKEYYTQDNLLQNLLGQRSRKIFDVSSSIQAQVNTGGSQVIIDNLKQVMISEASHFKTKSDKRRKQIELAVKMPNIYGRGQLYEPGHIPVNDFSYLAGINFLMDIEQQRKIVLDQADVDGVVLPIETKFTQQIESSDPVVLSHLLLANVPIGVTIDAAPASSAPSIAATDKISEDGLFALYNYLTVKTSDTSGTNFEVFNSSSKGISHNGQLVGEVSSILDLGLGLVYLEGVAIPSATSQETMERTGSYVKLPERPEFQDLLYNRSGATFETWVYVPSLDSANYGFNIADSVSGLYRLILANENVGLGPNVDIQDDILNMAFDKGSATSRGMIFGFTRDRRFSQELMPSNSETDNSTDYLSLVLAPTQSYDSSSAGFISRQTETCDSTSSWYGMAMDVWDNSKGLSLSSCGTEFCQISLTLNPNKDEIAIYMDGVSLAVSSYMDVFGVDPVKETPKIPSIVPDAAFEYSDTKVDADSADTVKAGPKLDSYFTPWILGGGYTDGNPDGNFMGGEYGGKVSGLKGYLGCTKFYSRPISPEEITKNYNATKNFFKNLYLGDPWEPILSE
jgi:hypothetical protein